MPASVQPTMLVQNPDDGEKKLSAKQLQRKKDQQAREAKRQAKRHEKAVLKERRQEQRQRKADVREKRLEMERLELQGLGPSSKEAEEQQRLAEEAELFKAEFLQEEVKPTVKHTKKSLLESGRRGDLRMV